VNPILGFYDWLTGNRGDLFHASDVSLRAFEIRENFPLMAHRGEAIVTFFDCV
jgi:hypothetical protein